MINNLYYKALDKGFIKVVDTMGDDSAIVQSARVSYGRGTKTKSKDEALINYLMKHNHTSPFEMCEIKLHIKAPLFVARQWVRHRTASINEVSARYSHIEEEFYYPKKWRKQDDINKQSSSGEIEEEGAFFEKGTLDILMRYNDIITASSDWYDINIEQGMAREMARMVIPQSNYTEFYWKIDLKNLLHFINLRIKPNAQEEIRVYAKIIKDIVKKWVPITYKAFVNYQMNTITFSQKEVEVLKRLSQYILLEDYSEHKGELSDKEFSEFKRKINLPE